MDPGPDGSCDRKLSGVRQVVAVTFHNYDRPIPSPVEELRPARETCEQCHWPLMFTGDKLVIRRKYSDDEKNTPLTTVLLMKIGGQNGGDGRRNSRAPPGREIARPVHSPRITRRQVLPQVTYMDDNGKKIEFTSTDVKPTPAQLAAGESRAMDCMDCHNRPAHTFQLPDQRGGPGHGRGPHQH